MGEDLTKVMDQVTKTTSERVRGGIALNVHVAWVDGYCHSNRIPKLINLVRDMIESKDVPKVELIQPKKNKKH